MVRKSPSLIHKRKAMVKDGRKRSRLLTHRKVKSFNTFDSHIEYQAARQAADIYYSPSADQLG